MKPGSESPSKERAEGEDRPLDTLRHSNENMRKWIVVALNDSLLGNKIAADQDQPPHIRGVGQFLGRCGFGPTAFRTLVEEALEDPSIARQVVSMVSRMDFPRWLTDLFISG